jgi:hypothetical protein
MTTTSTIESFDAHLSSSDGDFIQVYGGKKVHPLRLSPSDFDIITIAHALSHLCRYTGHINNFYSVAEHSVLVSRAVPKEHALWGLLHDAPEIIINDISRPIKVWLNSVCPEFKALETDIMHCVCDQYDLPYQTPECIKIADLSVLHDEYLAGIDNVPGIDWNLPYPPTGAQINFYYPGMAKAIFLMRYREIVDGF